MPLRRVLRPAIALCALLLISVSLLFSHGSAKWSVGDTGLAFALFNGLDSVTQLVQDAHKLPSADAFLPHIRAVTQLKGLTMAEAKSPCHWGDDDPVDFQYSEDFDWVLEDKDDTELEFRRNQWHDFLKNELLPYELYKDRFEGRGIVILAGPGGSLKRLKVLFRQLKRLGSSMPVEMHFWGDEFPPAVQESISALWPKVFFNDLSSSTNFYKTSNDAFFGVNYQLKTAALINSRFAEPLLLDSDNLPVIPPETLYASDTYEEFGTIFWPDIARTRTNNPAWAITNTRCRMDEYELESGQLLVDKRKFWYHLQLAAYFNNPRGEHFYYNSFLLGDKDMFRFAWHALKTPYGRPSKWVTSVGTLAPDGFYCGHTFAQHHPNGSVAFLHGGNLKTIPNPVMKWLRETQGGIFQVYKRSIVDERHDLVERVKIKMDGALYLPNRPDNMKAKFCVDMFDVHPRRLDEIVPGGFESAFEEIGGYWMLDDGEDDNS